MPALDQVSIPAFFLAHGTSCASWAALSTSERLRLALRYLYPGTFVDDGGATPWELVPNALYLQSAGFVGMVNAFCGTVQTQYPTVYLAQWPAYRWGTWGRPSWRWHGARTPHAPPAPPAPPPPPAPPAAPLARGGR